ncbi:MAG: DUF1330 domain-containing protein [Roseobacter sp.]
MPKAYWIAFVTVTDGTRYKGYRESAPAAFAKYGARFLVQGGVCETLEGRPFERHIVIEFASKEQALACYNSVEYQTAKLHRDDACNAQIAIVDGLPCDRG